VASVPDMLKRGRKPSTSKSLGEVSKLNTSRVRLQPRDDRPIAPRDGLDSSMMDIDELQMDITALMN